MSFPHHSQTPPARPVKFLAAALLGVAAAVLVACGSSGAGLIPAASAGPLQSDFEAVAQAAQSGNGNCLETESKLGQTQQDFLALPASVDAGLRKRLSEGIANLRKVALAMCAQPSAGTTTTTPTTTTPTTTTSTTTTPTTTTQTTTTPTTTTPTTTTPPDNGGGTPAPEESEESPGPGKGKGKGEGDGNSGGAGAGGASVEGGR
jgi:cytoskeletal protein RodZ